MKIAVAGTGYVGLVTGVCLASKGHQVTCVDINEEKILIMKKGKSPIYEPGLEELMQKNLDKLYFTTDYQSAYKEADVIFIGVGTPEKQDGSANLKYVYSVAKQIANTVETDCVIVVKSTVPIGTNEKIETFIKANLKHNVNVFIASNPEFLSQGTAVHDTLFASRIVLGVEEEYSAEILKKVYKDFDAPILVMNRKSAEMVKYASNDFLALKISYINEIANFCETVGANIEDVTKGMGYDPRIGDRFLKAGIGYGGSCFPKDTKALNWLANFNGNEIKTVRAAIDVNEIQKFKLIKKAKKYYEDFNGLTIAVLGLTFKPGTDDLREAPSMVNVPWLLEEGAIVKAWDPVGEENFKSKISGNITYCKSIETALEDADICFIFTEWEEIKRMDPSLFVCKMKTPLILDGRNCFDLKEMSEFSLDYISIGRPEVLNNMRKI